MSKCTVCGTELKMPALTCPVCGMKHYEDVVAFRTLNAPQKADSKKLTDAVLRYENARKEQLTYLLKTLGESGAGNGGSASGGVKPGSGGNASGRVKTGNGGNTSGGVKPGSGGASGGEDQKYERNRFRACFREGRIYGSYGDPSRGDRMSAAVREIGQGRASIENIENVVINNNGKTRFGLLFTKDHRVIIRFGGSKNKNIDFYLWNLMSINVDTAHSCIFKVVNKNRRIVFPKWVDPDSFAVWLQNMARQLFDHKLPVDRLTERKLLIRRRAHILNVLACLTVFAAVILGSQIGDPAIYACMAVAFVLFITAGVEKDKLKQDTGQP